MNHKEREELVERLIANALWELWSIKLDKSKPSEYLSTLPYDKQQQVKDFILD